MPDRSDPNYAEMDDATLVRLAATQGMRCAWWKDIGMGYGGPYPMATEAEIPDLGVPTSRPSSVDIYMSEDNDPEYFNPLESDADAFMLIDALDRTDFSLEKSGVNWTADFGGPWCATDPCRRRAIVLACLMVTDPIRAAMKEAK